MSKGTLSFKGLLPAHFREGRAHHFVGPFLMMRCGTCNTFACLVLDESWCAAWSFRRLADALLHRGLQSVEYAWIPRAPNNQRCVVQQHAIVLYIAFMALQLLLYGASSGWNVYQSEKLTSLKGRLTQFSHFLQVVSPMQIALVLCTQVLRYPPVRFLLPQPQ